AGAASCIVVVDLNNTVLDPHGIVRAALVQRGEHAVSTANHRSRHWLPAKTDTRLYAVQNVLDCLTVVGRERWEVVIDQTGRRRQLDIITNPGVQGELRGQLPAILREDVVHL